MCAEVTSIGKSVFFRTHHGLDYGYGGKYRDSNPPNLDKCILKENDNFDPIDKRKGLRILSIHVADLLISGSSDFIDYIACGMKENLSWVDMGGINQLIYARGLKIERFGLRGRNFRFQQLRRRN